MQRWDVNVEQPTSQLLDGCGKYISRHPNCVSLTVSRPKISSPARWCFYMNNIYTKIIHWSWISLIIVLTDTQSHSQVGDTSDQDGQQGSLRYGCLGILGNKKNDPMYNSVFVSFSFSSPAFGSEISCTVTATVVVPICMALIHWPLWHSYPQVAGDVGSSQDPCCRREKDGKHRKKGLADTKRRSKILQEDFRCKKKRKQESEEKIQR